MSTTMGDQVTEAAAVTRREKQRCGARGRPKSIAAFGRTRKAGSVRAGRKGPAVANATLGGNATAVWGVPTTTDVALEARIAGIAAALREAQQKRATLLRDWKIGQLQLALIAAVRMRTAAQVVRLTMRTETATVTAVPGGAPPAGGVTGAGGQS